VDRVTADSNIYVSAVRFGGKPLTLLEMALDGQIELAISDAILNETVGILRDKFHRTPEQLQGDETYIAACAKHVSPTEIIEAVPADPDDNRVLECAGAAGSDVIVTGDKHLLALGSFRGIDIVTVSDFLGRVSRRGR
jgi:putative PIN family toxin of toxin-antitoxin system